MLEIKLFYEFRPHRCEYRFNIWVLNRCNNEKFDIQTLIRRHKLQQNVPVNRSNRKGNAVFCFPSSAERWTFGPATASVVCKHTETQSRLKLKHSELSRHRWAVKESQVMLLQPSLGAKVTMVTLPAQFRKWDTVVGVVARVFLGLWLAAELAVHVCFLCLWITRGERGWMEVSVSLTRPPAAFSCEINLLRWIINRLEILRPLSDRLCFI